MGYVEVFGQILFMIIIQPILKFLSKKRQLTLIKNEGLHYTQIPENLTHHVESVNHPSVIELIKELKPDVIVINGTRIIGKRLLRSFDLKFINMHAGITPAFRGVHGGYWALASSMPEACGVTIHLVDEGIDTGNILSQGIIHPSKKDNFFTYPMLQLSKGLHLLKQAIEEVCQNKHSIKKPFIQNSKLWYHSYHVGVPKKLGNKRC